ncbi:hypothetical protein [Bradyrhizobium sp. USDA 4538]|nr:hypothetical protein [Bradyrhizobium sp. USDA 4538]
MSKKLPERVEGGARPESKKSAKVESEKPSDLVEIAKQNGDFCKNYGKFWGGLLLLSVINAAAGRRPLLWGGLLSAGTVAGGLLVKYGVPIFGG